MVVLGICVPIRIKAWRPSRTKIVGFVRTSAVPSEIKAFNVAAKPNGLIRSIAPDNGVDAP